MRRINRLGHIPLSSCSTVVGFLGRIAVVGMEYVLRKIESILKQKNC